MQSEYLHPPLWEESRWNFRSCAVEVRVIVEVRVVAVVTAMVVVRVKHSRIHKTI
jgi:hypothetical protein